MTNVEKLLATVKDKDFYTLHYKNLQLYVSLGLWIKKIHARIIFKQEPIMKSYVDFNSEKRAHAISLTQIFISSCPIVYMERLEKTLRNEVK